MKVTRSKKIIGPVLLILLLVVIVVISAVKVNAGNIRCDDFTDCTGKANCGGPGSKTGCTLECQDGPVIDCPEAD